MIVSRAGSHSRYSPRRKRAAPTPPARTAMRFLYARRRDSAIGGCPLYRNAARADDQGADVRFGQVFAGLATGRLGDRLLHQRAAEIVADGRQRELGELGPELHPRGLQVVD